MYYTKFNINRLTAFDECIIFWPEFHNKEQKRIVFYTMSILDINVEGVKKAAWKTEFSSVGARQGGID